MVLSTAKQYDRLNGFGAFSNSNVYVEEDLIVNDDATITDDLLVGDVITTKDLNFTQSLKANGTQVISSNGAVTASSITSTGNFTVANITTEGNFTADELNVSSGTLTLNNIVLSNDNVATSTLNISKANSNIWTEVVAGDTFTPNFVLEENTGTGDRWTIKKSPTVLGDNALVLNERKSNVGADRLTVTGGNFDFQDGDLTTNGDIFASVVEARSNDGEPFIIDTGQQGDCNVAFRNFSVGTSDAPQIGNSGGHLIIRSRRDNMQIKFVTEGVTRMSITNQGHLIPELDDTYNLGGPDTNRWKDIYTNGAVTTTSDANLKNSITSLGKSFSLEFVNSLNPVSFKYNNNNSDRTHWGLIAQELETAITDNNLTTQDCAVFVKAPKKIPLLDENGNIVYHLNPDGSNSSDMRYTDSTTDFNYMVRYQELIPVLIGSIKQLKTELDDCKNRLTTLESA